MIINSKEITYENVLSVEIVGNGRVKVNCKDGFETIIKDDDWVNVMAEYVISKKKKGEKLFD